MLGVALVKRLLPLMFLALSACGGTTPSSDVRTSGFFVTYRVASESGQAPIATAIFQVESSSGSDLALDGGDVVTCDGLAMDPTTDSGHNAYAANLPSDSSSFVFVLSRPGEVQDTRQVAASPALRIASTKANGANVSALDGTYDAQFDISWALAPSSTPSASGTVSIIADSADSSCPTQTIADKVGDVTTYSFDGSLFRPSDKSDPDCLYDVHVMRDVSTSISAPFAGGVLVSRNVVTTSLHLHP